MLRAMSPGTKVRLSGKFLRSTGQIAGSEGSKIWTVLHVVGSFVVVDEPRACLEDYTKAELAADPWLKWRCIAEANLTVVGQLDSRNCP